MGIRERLADWSEDNRDRITAAAQLAIGLGGIAVKVGSQYVSSRFDELSESNEGLRATLADEGRRADELLTELIAYREKFGDLPEDALPVADEYEGPASGRADRITVAERPAWDGRPGEDAGADG